MQIQTTASEHSNASILRYGFGGQNSSLGFGLTDINISKQRQNPLVPTAKPLTEEEAGTLSAKIFTFPIEKQHAKVAPLVAKNYVEGVVLSNDEISVRCELTVNGKVVEIQLPRSLFPESITYGLPINLKMVDEGGIRRPLITLRKIDDNSTANIADEFDSILNAL